MATTRPPFLLALTIAKPFLLRSPFLSPLPPLGQAPRCVRELFAHAEPRLAVARALQAV